MSVVDRVIARSKTAVETSEVMEALEAAVQPYDSGLVDKAAELVEQYRLQLARTNFTPEDKKRMQGFASAIGHLQGIVTTLETLEGLLEVLRERG